MQAADWLSLLTMGAGGLKSLAAGRSNRQARADAAALEREKLAQDEQQNQRSTAVAESTQDPFRQQMHQARDIGRLDLMQNATMAPMSFSFDPRYAKSVPTMSGGFSYTKGPDVTNSAAALKRNVMGGNVAPTMTDPANYGKTAALDLVRMAADGVDPATVSARSSRGAVPGATGPTDYLADVERRGGGTGGVLSGAAKGAGIGATSSLVPWNPFTKLGGAVVGGVVGAIAGAFSKKAKTAPSDVDVPTAVSVLTRVMQSELGRSPGPGEIEQMLAGQGLKPGDRWVGEQGLKSLIASLQTQATNLQPSYAAHG